MTSKYDINPERDSEAKVTNIHTIRKTPKVALNYLTALKSPKL